MSFVDQGEAESTKAAIHGSLMTLTALCLVYNIAACLKRPSQHLLLNIGVYSALLGFEAHQVKKHL